MLLSPVTLIDAAFNVPLAKRKSPVTDKAPIPLPPLLKVPSPSIVNGWLFPVIFPSVTVEPSNVTAPPSVTVPVYVCVPVEVIPALIVVVPLTDKALMSLPPFNTPLPAIVNE